MSNASVIAPASLNLSIKEEAARGRFDRWLFAGLCIYLTTLAIEGPLRFAMSYLKIATLLYARDLISATFIMASVVVARHHFKPQRVQMQLMTYLLITSFFATLYLGNGIISGLFAIKIFGTFLFGLAAYTVVITHPTIFRWIVAGLFVLTLIGVVINRFYGTFPWEGGLFESAFGTTEISRVWWISGGERRLAGFTRASPIAAGVIGITGAAMLVTLRNYWLRMLVMVTGMAGIYLTTSKGMIIAYAAVSGMAIMPIHTAWRVFSTRAAATLFFVLGLFAPLLSWYIKPGFGFMRSSPHILSSFADRISNSWPDTIDGFKHWYNWVVGQGLGGVGLPTAFSGKVMHFPTVDNLHLFLMGNFGLLGTFMFVMFYARIMSRSSSRDDATNAAMAVAIMGLGYGIVSNIADDSFSPIAMGIAWGLLSRPKTTT